MWTVWGSRGPGWETLLENILLSCWIDLLCMWHAPIRVFAWFHISIYPSSGVGGEVPRPRLWLKIQASTLQGWIHYIILPLQLSWILRFVCYLNGLKLNRRMSWACWSVLSWHWACLLSRERPKYWPYWTDKCLGPGGWGDHIHFNLILSVYNDTLINQQGKQTGVPSILCRAKTKGCWVKEWLPAIKQKIIYALIK